MFAKRPKKIFPPGTFIPTPARVMAILQLCIVFTVVLSTMAYPFMGALFESKSKALLYRTVMGDVTLASSSDKLASQQYREQLLRNKERFMTLPEDQRNALVNEFTALQHQGNTSLIDKLGDSLNVILIKLPSFERLWIVLAVAISIMLLKRIEGASKAVWLLPILAASYAFNNYQNGMEAVQSGDSQLFPSEELIVTKYLEKPLPKDIGEQQQQLLFGWKTYLIKEWAHQIPSGDPQVFERQAEDGDFAFNLTRLEVNRKNVHIVKTWHEKESPFILFCYFAWNFLFAWMVMRHSKSIALNRLNNNTKII